MYIGHRRQYCNYYIGQKRQYFNYYIGHYRRQYFNYFIDNIFSTNKQLWHKSHKRLIHVRTIRYLTLTLWILISHRPDYCDQQTHCVVILIVIHACHMLALLSNILYYRITREYHKSTRRSLVIKHAIRQSVTFRLKLQGFHFSI